MPQTPCRSCRVGTTRCGSIAHALKSWTVRGGFPIRSRCNESLTCRARSLQLGLADFVRLALIGAVSPCLEADTDLRRLRVNKRPLLTPLRFHAGCQESG